MIVPFDQVYYISLKNYPSRRMKMDKYILDINLMDKHGKSPIWYEANSGLNVDHLVDNSIKLQNRRAKMSMSEIGCFASHRAIWKIVAEGDAETVLILEDDARFEGDKFLDFMTNFDSLPEWDYINFGFKPIKGSIEDRLEIVQNPFFKTLYSGAGMWLTHAYAINKKAAEYFYRNTNVQLGCVDWQLTGLQGQIKSFGFNPELIKQLKVTMSNPSTIKHTQ